MMKKLFTVAVLALMMAGALVSCDSAAKKRATKFMDALKEAEYLEAAKMVMGIDMEDDLDEGTLSIAHMIEHEFEDDFKAGGGIKDYSLEEEDVDGDFTSYVVTIIMKDGSEMTADLEIEKDEDEWIGCSLSNLEQTKEGKGGAASDDEDEADDDEEDETDAAFILGDNKLGPLSLGQTVASLPESVEGLYDSYKYDKVEIENEMEGSWTEEWCYFYKDGKEIFKAFAEGKKLESFVLEEGSSFIKTTEGYYVGYNARNLFTQKPMEWETWYTGTTFARDGRWEYHIASDDLIGGVDTPTRVDNIKETAKIVQIAYYKKSPV